MLKKTSKLPKRIFLLFVILFAILILQKSSPLIVFFQPPVGTAVWEVMTHENNIGSVIKVMLRIETAPGIHLDLSKMPDVGEVWKLPAKELIADTSSPVTPPGVHFTGGYPAYDSLLTEVGEGEVEVLSRKVEKFSKKDRVITVITYELQYLVPLDLSEERDAKRLNKFLNIIGVYFQYYEKSRTTEREVGFLDVTTAEFFLTPRVDENFRPILRFYNPPEIRTSWFYLKNAGFSFVVFTFSLAAFLCQNNLRARRHNHTVQPFEFVLPKPGLWDYYFRWQESLDYAVFIEAVIQYRAQHELQAEIWEKSTIILYSGVLLNSDQINDFFKEILKEVSDAYLS